MLEVNDLSWNWSEQSWASNRLRPANFVFVLKTGKKCKQLQSIVFILIIIENWFLTWSITDIFCVHSYYRFVRLVPKGQCFNRIIVQKFGSINLCKRTHVLKEIFYDLTPASHARNTITTCILFLLDAVNWTIATFFFGIIL